MKTHNAANQNKCFCLPLAQLRFSVAGVKSIFWWLLHHFCVVPVRVCWSLKPEHDSNWRNWSYCRHNYANCCCKSRKSTPSNWHWTYCSSRSWPSWSSWLQHCWRRRHCSRMTPWNTSNRQTRNSTSQTTDLIGSQKRLIPSVTKSEKQLIMTILVRTRFLNLSIPKEKVVFSVMKSNTHISTSFIFVICTWHIYLVAINSSNWYWAEWGRKCQI